VTAGVLPIHINVDELHTYHFLIIFCAAPSAHPLSSVLLAEAWAIWLSVNFKISAVLTLCISIDFVEEWIRGDWRRCTALATSVGILQLFFAALQACVVMTQCLVSVLQWPTASLSHFATIDTLSGFYHVCAPSTLAPMAYSPTSNERSECQSQ
jgi:hypothetical protein